MSPWRRSPHLPPKSPFEVFMLGLCLWQSLPLLRGESGSATLEHALPDSTVTLWGVALLLGSAVSLIGLALPRKYRLVGLIVERSGLILMSGAVAIYAFIILREAGSYNDVRFTASLHVGFAFACAWRVVQLTKTIRWAISFSDLEGRGSDVPADRARRGPGDAGG